MINNSLTNSALRVTILSDSVVQRTSLKTLLSEQGSKIVGENSLGGYIPDAFDDAADVLLIDLKNADEKSLDKIEDLMDHSRIPVLFNDGATIPAADGPVRDDWANNLTKKLYKLANKESENPAYIRKQHRAMKIASDSKAKKNQTVTLKKIFPRVAIISKSKTRRNVLKNVLNQQGLVNINAQSFKDVNLADLHQSVDILLVDQHNLTEKNDKSSFSNITQQNKIGILICNSSRIPLDSKERMKLGNKLLKKLTSKATQLLMNKKQITRFENNELSAKLSTNSSNISDEDLMDQISISEHSTKTPSIAPLFNKDPVHWAEHLSDALAGVRNNLRTIEKRKIDITRAPMATNEYGSNNLLDENAEENTINLSVISNPGNKSTTIDNTAIVNIEIEETEPAVSFTNNEQFETEVSYSDDENTENHETELLSNPGILDIYSDMLKAVKEVPSEFDSSFLFTEKQKSEDFAATDEQKPENISTFTDPDQIPALSNLDENQDHLSSDFQFSDEFIFNTGAGENNEVAFESELTSLKSDLDIFEDDKEDMLVFADSPPPSEKRKLLGISWSNPFK